MDQSRRSSVWIALMCAAIATAITGCAIHYTDVSGTERNRRVVDKATGGGVPEAFVVFQWDQDRDTFAHSTTTCARLAVVKTGADGRYMVPDWGGRVPLVNRIYKRGYVSAADDVSMNRGVDYITSSTRTGDDRGEELNHVMMGCNDDEDRKLIEFYQALYDELRATMPMGKKSRFDRAFEARIEAATYGSDDAFRRHEERVRREGGRK